MLRNPFFRITSVLWLLIVSVVLWEDREIFRAPQYEYADYAANALAIDSAKHGREIYGNYSRFNFRHPGPAFEYAYAAGEIVFEDWLGVISPRHNAHLLTGILLQAAFLSLALGIAASHSVTPWRSALLLTGIALIHFSLVPGAFTEIWPPLVLIMPFALLVVAAASVAAGRTGHVVWLALGAGFLLHGHIAQFLLVGGVLLAVAGAVAYRRTKVGPAPSPSRAQWLAVALIGALTVSPWVIDAIRGRESNIFDIWLHIKRSAHDSLRPSWQAAVADTASYFFYCTRQNDWFSPGATLTCQLFLKTYILGVLGALVGFLCCGWALWRGRGSRGPSAVFQRHLAGICAISVLLCIVWARRQDGGIYFFNSLFIFGLMMAIWVIPCLTLAESATGSAGALVFAALVSACAATAGRFGERPDYLGSDALGQEAAVKVPRWLSREVLPQRAKLLIFSHDEWEEAATVAAALSRLGIRFFVPESDNGAWKVMFGEDHVIQSIEEARALGPFSWWKPALGHPMAAERLVRDLRDDSSGHERRRFPLDFNLRHPEESFGLSKPEGEMTWTESKVVLMRLWSESARSDVRMTFRASALPRASGGSQRVRVLANGRMLHEIMVTQLSDYSITVPEKCWNGGTSPGLVELAWELPDSCRPASQPDSDNADARLLGVCLHKLQFGLVAPADGFGLPRKS